MAAIPAPCACVECMMPAAGPAEPGQLNRGPCCPRGRPGQLLVWVTRAGACGVQSRRKHVSCPQAPWSSWHAAEPGEVRCFPAACTHHSTGLPRSNKCSTALLVSQARRLFQVDERRSFAYLGTLDRTQNSKRAGSTGPTCMDTCLWLATSPQRASWTCARPQIVRVRCAQGRRDDELSDILTRCSWARPLLTAVIYVQLGTSCPTSRTISDREQATK